MIQPLTYVLNEIPPISLREMKEVALMRRTDTKFIVHQAQLPGILRAIRAQYSVLEIGRKRTMTYASQYFDTVANTFYHDHHNGKADRTKIRVRSYVESDLCFLEVKRKDSKGVTYKQRVRVPAMEAELPVVAGDFIERTTGRVFELIPSIRNQFQRITLVDTIRKERVTLDLNLSSCFESVELEHKNLVIVEVKQLRRDRQAPVVQVLKSLGIRPYRISKYCIGMICLRADIKYNRFKPKLLRIRKVTSQPLNQIGSPAWSS
jgi:hypothetical protein